MKHRLLLNPLPDAGSDVELSAEENRHARVLRLREGEQIELFDGEGHAAEAEVVSLAPSLRVRVLSTAPSREADRQVTLCLALIQPEKFELAIQKATELGVAAIQPIVSEHCEVRPERVGGKLDRWRKIASEAAKQCGRARVPPVHEPVNVSEVLQSGASADSTIFFDISGGSVPRFAHPVSALIGPEGGWSERELAAFREAGASVASLGSRRLRAETAAMVAVALLTAPWDES